MRISQHGEALVLSYPMWLGAALTAVAFALLALAVIARKRLRRRWAVPLAAVLAAWAGVYFATFRATIGEESGAVYAFMRQERTLLWEDAADVYLERRGRHNDWHIVVLDHDRRPFDIDVADLASDQRDRVMAFIVDRVPASAFPREPALLKRQAPQGARRVGLFSDQQT